MRILILKIFDWYTFFWDIDFLLPINHSRNAFLDILFSILSYTAAWIAILVPLAMLFQGIKLKVTRKIVDAGFLVLSVGLSALVTGIIKYRVQRPRPFEIYFEIEKMASGGTPSFPSGHATDAFSFATAISIIYPKWYVVISVYWWAFLVAYSRMYLGVHYLTDVVAGALIGIYVVVFICLVMRWMGVKRNELFLPKGGNEPKL